MDGQMNNLNDEQDDEKDEAMLIANEEELESLTIRNKRRAIIDEYEDSVVERHNRYGGIIGMGTADLSRIFEYYQKAILDDIEASPPSMEKCEQLRPHIRQLLNIRSSIALDIPFQTVEAEDELNAFPRRLEKWQIDARAKHSIKRGIPGR